MPVSVQKLHLSGCPIFRGRFWFQHGDQHGEPFEDVWERAKRFRRYLFRRYAGRKILVVSHGVFLQMFYGVLRRSTCIESLASYPANLELRRFDCTDDRLEKETVIKLTDVQEKVAW